MRVSMGEERRALSVGPSEWKLYHVRAFDKEVRSGSENAIKF